MFIQTEATANLDVMKFLPGRTVLDKGVASFRDARAAARSPLAERLFEIQGVIGILLDNQAIAVTKDKETDWYELKPAILGVVMEHFMADRPVLLDPAPGAGEGGEGGDAESEIVAQLKDLILERVRPAVEQSGGNIKFLGYENGVVKLTSTKSGVVAGLRHGIENILRHYVSEVAEVRFLEHRPSPEENVRDNKPGLNGEDAIAIYDLLDDEINPAVASHGGHIALVDVKDDTAFIRLEGGCQGCGMADVTLKSGIETAIKKKVPSILTVLDSTDHAGGSNPYYQPGAK